MSPGGLQELQEEAGERLVAGLTQPLLLEPLLMQPEILVCQRSNLKCEMRLCCYLRLWLS
jgi:hypothetical protein